MKNCSTCRYSASIKKNQVPTFFCLHPMDADPKILLPKSDKPQKFYYVPSRFAIATRQGIPSHALEDDMNCEYHVYGSWHKKSKDHQPSLFKDSK